MSPAPELEGVTTVRTILLKRAGYRPTGRHWGNVAIEIWKEYTETARIIVEALEYKRAKP